MKEFAKANFKFHENERNLSKQVEKTLWEKEKLLITSNFSFSHNVFKRLVSQGRQKVSLCGNGLMILKKEALENTVGKEENSGNQHFLLFQVFSTLT